MATQTTNYNLPVIEGSDTVNLLTVLPDLANKVDAQMKVNSNTGIQRGTHSKSGTVNSVTVPTNLATGTFFTFVAADDFTEGDSFTFNGEVIAARTPEGKALKTGAFTINQNVLCCNYNGILTIYTNQSAFVVDQALNVDSENAISNAAVTTGLNTVKTDIGNADISGVGTTVKNAIINLDADITVTNNAVSQLSTNLGELQFKKDADGNPQVNVNGEWVNFPSGGGADLLWTNPSPNNFASQKVTLDLTKYTYVAIEFLFDGGNTTANNAIICIAKNTARVVGVGQSINSFSMRQVTNVDNTGVTFGNGYYNINTMANANCSPYRIWGLNKVFE